MATGKEQQNYHLSNRLLTVCLVAAVLMLTACGSKTTTTLATTTPPSVTVAIEDMIILLSTITVPVGTTVTWSNLEIEQHTITSDTGLFDSLLSDPPSDPINATFSYTFTERGTFSYHCRFHTFIIGTVIVE